MDPKNAIEIRNLVKRFKIEVEDTDKKSTIFNKNPTKVIENTVLDNISLDIRKGDVLGVIGRNGSGKSTFLSLIAKIMEPDSGTIECSGKVASILELGMGFHQDLSGRENIYLKGELYGFSRKEMESRIDKIIEYSGISKYIDNPVRTYSSGMSGRLAFSIMMNVESDIMLVDEVLSVGDATFIAKAKEHFKKLAKSGKTVVFVSHSINDMAEMCTRAVWIENGRIIKDGKAKDICAEYQNKMASSPEIISDLAEAGVAQSQYELGLMYRDGIHFGKSDELYVEWMKKAADQGHTLAQVEYADILMKSESSDHSEIMNLYQSAANKGNNDARLKLASLNRTGTDPVREEVRKIFLQMAEEGEAINQFRCGDFLLKTAWTNEDRALAFSWFVKSAEQNYSNAVYQVGIMQRDGIGTPRDYSKMEESLRKAADMGYVPSIALLADIYIQGKLIPKNESEAFKYYLKGASLGNGRCMYQAAVMYRDGVGTDVNLEQSEKWFSLFADSPLVNNYVWAADWSKIHNPSIHCLVKIFERNALLGNIASMSNVIDINYLNANKCDLDMLHHMASNGNLDAIKRLASKYYDGIGVGKDYSEALKWYSKAAELGDTSALVRCGEMYRDGRGTVCDIGKASEYFKNAMRKGNISSIANLISMYVSGVMADNDLAENCLGTLKCLALNGNLDAVRRLAAYYYDGVYVSKDYAEALKWYSKAAELGDQNSKIRCAEIYRDGKGVGEDCEKSFLWFIR